MLGGLDQTGLAGVVHHQYQGALCGFNSRHGIARRDVEVMSLAHRAAVHLQLSLDDDHLPFGPGKPRRLAVAAVQLHRHGTSAGVGVHAQHFVVHAPAEARQRHILEGNVAIDKRFYVWARHIISPLIIAGDKTAFRPRIFRGYPAPLKIRGSLTAECPKLNFVPGYAGLTVIVTVNAVLPDHLVFPVLWFGRQVLAFYLYLLVAVGVKATH